MSSFWWCRAKQIRALDNGKPRLRGPVACRGESRGVVVRVLIEAPPARVAWSAPAIDATPTHVAVNGPDGERLIWAQRTSIGTLNCFASVSHILQHLATADVP